MVSNLSLLIFLSPLAWLLYNANCLALNYRLARKVGVPLIVLPISADNVLWLIVGKFLIPLFERMPFGNGNFARFNRHGWQVKDDAKAHLEFGDAFITVTPASNWMYVCNADAVADMFRRDSDFPRPLEVLAMLNVFGPNVSTVEGAAWRKQRKITASSFNERNMGLVWNESLRQAREMLEWWILQDGKGVRSTAKNMSTLTLHVLVSAGFGKSYPFQDSSKFLKNQPDPMNYRDALSLILENAIIILALGPKFLARLSRPKSLARLGQATVTFKKYMTDVLEEEKGLMAQGKPGRGNLMNSLIRASDDITENNHDGSVVTHTHGGLTENEIFGNMFVFSFAGHDTTAHTLTFTIFLLAAHPAVQVWLREELQYYLSDVQPQWSYQEKFPKLKRSLAVLLETLRLYLPLIGVSKGTASNAQTLNVGGKTLHLHPNMHVNPNLLALHVYPRYWGKDSLQWRPSRWIMSPSSSDPCTNPYELESFYVPPKGSFYPFSEGARSCPGKKFAQVEHVAVIATLFQKHQVQPVLQAGESMDQALKRIMEVVNDRGMVLLMQILHPEKGVLEWRKASRT